MASIEKMYSVIPRATLERFERNFRDLFSKANKSISMIAFLAIMTLMTASWITLYGLIYKDMQDFKATYMEQRHEITKAIGDLKAEIARITPHQGASRTIDITYNKPGERNVPYSDKTK